MNEDYEELEKFLKKKGYEPRVNGLDGRIIFKNMKTHYKGDSIKLRMIVTVGFGAVMIKEEKK